MVYSRAWRKLIHEKISKNRKFRDTVHLSSIYTFVKFKAGWSAAFWHTVSTRDLWISIVRHPWVGGNGIVKRSLLGSSLWPIKLHHQWKMRQCQPQIHSVKIFGAIRIYVKESPTKNDASLKKSVETRTNTFFLHSYPCPQSVKSGKNLLNLWVPLKTYRVNLKFWKLYFPEFKVLAVEKNRWLLLVFLGK